MEPQTPLWVLERVLVTCFRPPEVKLEHSEVMGKAVEGRESLAQSEKAACGGEEFRAFSAPRPSASFSPAVSVVPAVQMLRVLTHLWRHEGGC